MVPFKQYHLDRFYDNPPPQKKKRDFLSRAFHGCSTEGRDTVQNQVSTYFLVCKGLSIDDVGEGVVWCRGTPYCRRYDREGVGFETGDFVKEKLGGATVVRLFCVCFSSILPRGRSRTFFWGRNTSHLLPVELLKQETAGYCDTRLRAHFVFGTSAQQQCWPDGETNAFEVKVMFRVTC